MRKLIASCGVLLLSIAGMAMPSLGQADKKPASPPAKAECKLGGNTITVDYSSPRMKGRKIYGGLVPLGQVWRAGANSATTFVTTTDLTVDGKAVPAGSYTLFAIPNDDKLSSPVENFTIAFAPADAGCTLRLDWETTRASVPISAKK